jgi:hypothetical protein
MNTVMITTTTPKPEHENELGESIHQEVHSVHLEQVSRRRIPSPRD